LNREASSAQERQPFPPINLRADLHGRAFDWLRDQDRLWFEAHPGKKVRHRPAFEHEFCDPRLTPFCVSLLEAPPNPETLDRVSAELWVEVTELAVGVRTRRAYWVFSPEGVAL
jgi:hypothetical protein